MGRSPGAGSTLRVCRPFPRVVSHEARQKSAAEENSQHAEDASQDDRGLKAEGGGAEAGFGVAQERAAHVAHHLDPLKAAPEGVGDGQGVERGPLEAAEA